jgi:thiol-disulfide isomerase/thioredoxin
MSKKISVYWIVFGIVALIIILAAASTFLFSKSTVQKNLSLSNLTNYGPAPNIQGISAWINSQPLNLGQLKGKVVLVDFWTYSCINCIRSIPYLNAWESKYGENGLVIIGVSTPEFPFEMNYTNVKNAVETDGIKYPVALDNNYSTWDAYNNHYWPADYLIDKNGDIRYEAFGEGGYNQTEQVIVELLENAGYNVTSNATLPKEKVNFSLILSPELYLGWQRARAALGNMQGEDGFEPNQTVNYTFTNITQSNVVYLSGLWYNYPDGMVAESNNSKIYLYYSAKYVNVVAGDINASNTSIITIKLDGTALNQSSLGSDATLVNGNAIVRVNSPRLYNIIATPNYGAHVVEIDATKGFKIYTFTFG